MTNPLARIPVIIRDTVDFDMPRSWEAFVTQIRSDLHEVPGLHPDLIPAAYRLHEKTVACGPREIMDELPVFLALIVS